MTNSGGVWTETVLYSFAGGNDAQNPSAGLVMDSSGALYGTTIYVGGTNGVGTVFELKPSGDSWTETVLHSFTGQPDGQKPGYGPLLLASSGALYGTTAYGGSYDWGTVFDLTKSGGKWKEKILYNFTGGADGAHASGGIINGASGALFGSTALGGTYYGGTVYELSKVGGGWKEGVVYNFPGDSGDGFFPQGSVIFDKKSATLYGTTTQGGTDGWGTVYQDMMP